MKNSNFEIMAILAEQFTLTVAASARIEAMKADNEVRAIRQESPAWSYNDFDYESDTLIKLNEDAKNKINELEKQ